MLARTKRDVTSPPRRHPRTTFVKTRPADSAAASRRRPSATLLQLAQQSRHAAREREDLPHHLNEAAISALIRVVNRYVGNLVPMPRVFPNYKAPIVRTGADGRELATARWGMPSSQHAQMEATKRRAAKLEAKGKSVDLKELLRMEPDGGTTKIRDVTSKH